MPLASFLQDVLMPLVHERMFEDDNDDFHDGEDAPTFIIVDDNARTHDFTRLRSVLRPPSRWAASPPAPIRKPIRQPSDETSNGKTLEEALDELMFGSDDEEDENLSIDRWDERSQDDSLQLPTRFRSSLTSLSPCASGDLGRIERLSPMNDDRAFEWIETHDRWSNSGKQASSPRKKNMSRWDQSNASMKSLDSVQQLNAISMRMEYIST